MAPIIPLLLVAALLYSKGNSTEPILEERNESTDYELLCADQSLKLDFSNFRIEEINKHFLSSILITCLDFQGNIISQVNTGAFNNLPNLKYLEISFNHFRINDVFYNDFPNLEVLVAKGNSKDYYVNLNINGVYPKLRKLFLNGNFIDIMNAFPSLTHLYLSQTRIQQDYFNWLPQTLEYLDLTGHNLNSLTLTNLPNLKQLFIDQSYDRRLQTITFKNLINLKSLSLASNSIKEISFSTFTNLTSLLYLDLSDNNIRTIEAGELDSMQELRFLNLSRNELEILQGGTFDNLVNLKTLILEKNGLIAFPMINNETKLESLMLNCNKIKSIIGGTFANMPFLETLFLHGNEISYIDQFAFNGLIKLKILTLSNNNLSILPINWMLPMVSLEDLDLSGNHFIEFGNLALSDTSILKNLYLSKQILSIKAHSLFSVPDNVTISFDENIVFVEKCTESSEEDPYSRHRYG